MISITTVNSPSKNAEHVTWSRCWTVQKLLLQASSLPPIVGVLSAVGFQWAVLQAAAQLLSVSPRCVVVRILYNN